MDEAFCAYVPAELLVVQIMSDYEDQIVELYERIQMLPHSLKWPEQWTAFFV